MNREEAEAVYERGARRNPESPELFTQIGLMAFEVRFDVGFFQILFIHSLLYRKQIIQKHLNVLVQL